MIGCLLFGSSMEFTFARLARAERWKVSVLDFRSTT